MSSSSNQVLVPVAAPASPITVGGACTVVLSTVDTASTVVPEPLPQWRVEQSALDALNAERAKIKLQPVTQSEAKSAIMGGWAKYIAMAEARLIAKRSGVGVKVTPGPLMGVTSSGTWIEESGVIPEAFFQGVETMAGPVAKPKPEPKKPHPLAIPSHKSGANGMKNGDHVKHDPDGRTGRADEFLSDGDCLITWGDGTYGCVKWNNLSPSPLPPEPEPVPEPPVPIPVNDFNKGLVEGRQAATGQPMGVKQALIMKVRYLAGAGATGSHFISTTYAEGFEEGVKQSA